MIYRFLLSLFIGFLTLQIPLIGTHQGLQASASLHASLQETLLEDTRKVIDFLVKENPPQTLNDINLYAQKYFLRPKGHERFAPETIAYYSDLLKDLSDREKAEMLLIFKGRGYLDTRMATEANPDFVLIMGATIQTMRGALDFLNKLVKKTKWIPGDQQIVFLTGDRPLFERETPEVLKDPSPHKVNPDWRAPDILPTNETDLGPFIWAQLDLTPDLRSATPLFIKSGKKQGASRANTADTVVAFLKGRVLNPHAKIWVVSSNPMIDYQVLVTKTLFAKAGYKDLQIEGVGPSLYKTTQSADLALSVLLDTLARSIYQSLQLSRAMKN